MNYIYTIGNTKNNMVYIGQTSRDVETRFKEHKTLAREGGSEDKFHQAMRTIGVKNFFIKEVLGPISDEELDFQESFHIAANNSYHCGYNSNGGPCGDLREWYLDNEVWRKAITNLSISGRFSQEQLFRLVEIGRRGVSKPNKPITCFQTFGFA